MQCRDCVFLGVGKIKRKFNLLLASFMLVLIGLFGLTANTYALESTATLTEGGLAYDSKTFTGPESGEYSIFGGQANYYSYRYTENEVKYAAFIWSAGEINVGSTASYGVFIDDGSWKAVGEKSSIAVVEEAVETTTGTETEAAAETEAPTGDCPEGVGAMGWLICPVSQFLASAVDSLYGVLEGFLVVQPLTFEEDNAIQAVWRYMLGVANVAFIIFIIVVIYSQITGIGFSNYNIKKVLPRVIVAALLVNLSYVICALAVDVSNILGNQLSGLFKSIQESTIMNNLVEVPVGGGETAAWAIGGTVGVGATVLLGLAANGTAFGLFLLILPVLLSAVIAVIAAIITLAARQALVMILILISPLALVAYLLPNTEKWFGKWKDLLLKMLILYPTFSLLFGACQLAGFAIIASAQSVLTLILGMAVQVVPLIVTPSLVKMSGTILGKVNDAVRKPFSPLQKAVGDWSKQRRDIERQKGISNGYNGGRMPHARLAAWMDANRKRREDYLKQLADDNQKNAGMKNIKRAYEVIKDADGNITGVKAKTKTNPITGNTKMNKYAQRDLLSDQLRRESDALTARQQSAILNFNSAARKPLDDYFKALNEIEDQLTELRGKKEKLPEEVDTLNKRKGVLLAKATLTADEQTELNEINASIQSRETELSGVPSAIAAKVDQARSLRQTKDELQQTILNEMKTRYGITGRSVLSLISRVADFNYEDKAATIALNEDKDVAERIYANIADGSARIERDVEIFADEEERLKYGWAAGHLKSATGANLDGEVDVYAKVIAQAKATITESNVKIRNNYKTIFDNIKLTQEIHDFIKGVAIVEGNSNAVVAGMEIENKRGDNDKVNELLEIMTGGLDNNGEWHFDADMEKEVTDFGLSVDDNIMLKAYSKARKIYDAMKADGNSVPERYSFADFMAGNDGQKGKSKFGMGAVMQSYKDQSIFAKQDRTVLKYIADKIKDGKIPKDLADADDGLGFGITTKGMVMAVTSGADGELLDSVNDLLMVHDTEDGKADGALKILGLATPEGIAGIRSKTIKMVNDKLWKGDRTINSPDDIHPKLMAALKKSIDMLKEPEAKMLLAKMNPTTKQWLLGDTSSRGEPQTDNSNEGPRRPHPHNRRRRRR